MASSVLANENRQHISAYQTQQRVLRRVEEAERTTSPQLQASLPWRFPQSIQKMYSIPGAFVNLWQIILIHTIWGCVLIFIYRYLVIINPLIIESFSSQACAALRRNDILRLATVVGSQTGTDFIDKPEVMEIDHAPKARGFMDLAGTVELVRYGRGEDDVAIHLAEVHPAHISYRPLLRKCRQRLNWIVSALGVGLKATAAAVASELPTETPKVDVLKEIHRRTTLLAEETGLKAALDNARQEVKEMELGHSLLVGRFVASDDSQPAKKGHEKRTLKKAAYINHGPRALGAPRSSERSAQLKQWRNDAAEREEWGQQPTFIGPKGQEIWSDEYEEWFLGVGEGVSFLRSANALANEDRFDIGAHNASLAAQAREDDAGDDFAKSQFDAALPGVLRALEGPSQKAVYENRPGIARCSSCNATLLVKDKNGKHRCSSLLLEIEGSQKDSLPGRDSAARLRDGCR